MSNNSSSKDSRTDWERLDSLSDDEIDFSDIPELTPEDFTKATIRKGLKPTPSKQRVTLHIDTDVLDWFKRQDSEYHDHINALLRAYKDAREPKQNK